VRYSYQLEVQTVSTRFLRLSTQWSAARGTRYFFGRLRVPSVLWWPVVYLLTWRVRSSIRFPIRWSSLRAARAAGEDRNGRMALPAVDAIMNGPRSGVGL